jgi:hypothetical protein
MAQTLIWSDESLDDIDEIAHYHYRVNKRVASPLFYISPLYPFIKSYFYLTGNTTKRRAGGCLNMNRESGSRIGYLLSNGFPKRVVLPMQVLE